MSDGIEIQALVVGNEEIRQSFLDIGSSIRERLRRVLADAGQEIASAAAGAAPMRTGKLAGSIRPALVETGNKLTESIAPRGRYGSLIGRLMEFGVVSHGGASNRNAAGGKRAKVRRVRELRAAGQYRIAPRPFMGPAYDSLRSRVEAEIEAAVAAEVQG